MIRNYKPIKFTNPSSNQHVVRLKPGQNMEIFLDEKIFPKPTISSDSNFFRIENCNKNDYFKKFKIYQKSFLLNWLEYSAVYLGSLIIKSNICKSKIAIIAESSNVLKANTVAVLNPSKSFVRLIPGDILEVILFDEEKKIQNQEWEWSFSKEHDCDIELLGHESFLFDSQNKQSSLCPDLTYAALSRTQEKCIQHHFWFRFDKRLMKLLECSKSASQNMGELFFVEANKKIKRSISINMTFQKKHKTRVLNSLLLSKLKCEQCDKESYEFIFLNEVEIKKFNSTSFFEGCRVKSILPTSNFDILNSSYGVYDQESI